MSSKNITLLNSISRKESKRLLKEERSRDRGEKKKEKEQKGPRYLELEIMDDDGGMFGRSGNRDYALTTTEGLAVGDVWKCMVSTSPEIMGMSARDAFPVERIRAASNVTVASGKETRGTPEPEPGLMEAPASPAPGIEELLGQIEMLKAENRELSKNLDDSKARVNCLERQNSSMAFIEKQNRKMQRGIRSLSTQVKSLEKDRKNVDIGNLRSECESWKQKYESETSENERLRGIIRMLEANRGAVKRESTYLTGPTGIHSTLFHDERYRVYVSPGMRTARFIPDENGKVECRNGDVSIPALRYFTGFESIRSLDVVTEGEEIVVNLDS